MSKQRKDTPKRPRKQWKPEQIAAIIVALGTVISAIAALLTALKP